MRLVARERDERGAVAPFAALMLTVLLLAAAFVVDLGMQRVGRADVQALADVVALDLARDLDGTKSVAQLNGTIANDAAASKARNGDVVGEGVRVTPVLGKLDAAGRFVELTGSAVPTAVKVVAHTDVGFAFGGLTDVDSGAASRSAVATASTGACFAVGSYAASLDSAQSTLLSPILGALLGSNVTLQAVGYNGLASASVRLTDLVELGGLGVGTVDELLTAQLRVGDLYVALARVLDHQGNAAQATVLRSLSVAATTPRVVLGSLLAASATDQAALGATFNVLDLVTGAAYLANKNHAVAIPSLGVTVPGIATVGAATLTVVEAPQIACGGVGTTAHTAQVRLELPLTVNAQTVSVAGVGSVTLKKTELRLTANLGQATGTLTGVACANGSATSMSVSVASSLVGSTSVAGSMGFTVDVNPTRTSPVNSGLFTLIQSVLGLLTTVNVSVDSSVSVGASTPGSTIAKPMTIALPADYDTRRSTGSGPVLNPLTTYAAATTSVKVTAKLLGILNTSIKYYDGTDTTGIFNAVVGPIGSYVTGTLLNQTVSGLQTSVVDPLSRLLGLSLGGADVFAIPTATCTNPRLRA